MRLDWHRRADKPTSPTLTRPAPSRRRVRRALLAGLLLPFLPITPAVAGHGVSVEAFVEIGGTAASPTATLTLENAWTSQDSLSNVRLWDPSGNLLSTTPTTTSSTTSSGGIHITLQTFTFALPTSGTAGLYSIGMTASACGCRAAAMNVKSSAYVSFQTGFHYDPADPLDSAGSPRFNAALLRDIPEGQVFSQDLGGFSPNGHQLRYSFIEDSSRITSTDTVLQRRMRDGAPVTRAGLAADNGGRSRNWTDGTAAFDGDLAEVDAAGRLTVPAAATAAIGDQSSSSKRRLSVKVLIEEIETVGDGDPIVRGYATRDIGFRIVETSNVAPSITATVDGAALPAGPLVIAVGQTIDVVVLGTDADSGQQVALNFQNMPSWATALTPEPDSTNPRTRTLRLAPPAGTPMGSLTLIATATDNDATFPLTSQLLIPLRVSVAPTVSLGDGEVIVSWSAVAEADGYRVRYRQIGNSDWTESSDIAGGSTTSFALSAGATGLAPETAYEFQFASFTSDSDTVTLSPWSESATVTTHPAIAWSTSGTITPVLDRPFTLDLEDLVSGGGGDPTFSIVSGALPAGLALVGSEIRGEVEDSSLVGEEFPILLRATDAASGTTADTNLTLQPATIGQLLTTDYGSAPKWGGAFFWRGYAFQVTERTVVTHLVGGGREELGTGKRFDGALFAASGGTGPSYGKPSSILAEVTFEADAVNQAVELAAPVVLDADTWYFLAQGSVEGTVYHWYVDSLSAADLVTASSRIKVWEPLGSGSDGKGQALIWSGGNHDASDSSILDRAPSTTPDKPAVGIRYLTFDTPPSVETVSFDEAPAQPFRGRMTGGTSGAAYILHGSSSALDAGSVLSFIGSVGPDATFELTGLTGITASNYYYAARAVNDAGASQGSIESFATRGQTISGLDPPSTLTYGDDPFSVTLTSTSGLPVTLQASGGACASSGSTVTVISAGTCTLTATQTGGWDGDDFWRQASTSVSRTVAPRTVTLTGSFTAQTRVYDGTIDVVIDRSGLMLGPEILPGDTVTITSAIGAFGDPEVGSAKPVDLSTVVLSGSEASRYTLSQAGAPQATASILAIPLTVSAGTFAADDKVYDGTAAATVTGSGLTLSGFVSGDSMADITWTPTGRFTSTDAGPGVTVELAGGAVLGGLKGANYTLDVTGAPTATASITPRPVTITGASAAGRPYDGTTAVTVSGASLANTVAGDAVTLANATSGVAASRNAGTQGVSTSMTLSGADAANYRLAGQPSLSVTITPLPVDVTMNALPSRAYDGSSALPLSPGAFSVTGVLAGESIAVSGTGQLSSRAAGTRTVTVTPTFTPAGGTELVNYTLPTSVSGTVTVTPLPLRVVGAAVTSRVWDGSTAATISGATLEGVRAGDAVSLTAASSGTFASAQPGTHAARFTPTLVGVDAANYTLSVPELSGTITRAPASLRLTGGLTQFADGSPRTVRAAVSPAGAGRVVITYGGGGAPTAPGSYPASVTLDSSTHEASSLSATLTVQPVEDLLDVLGPAADPDAGPDADRGTVEERRAAVLARIAMHSDGTHAYPEIGPVLAEDGTAPALIPNDRRVLSDGEPVESRVSVVEDERVRVESDGGFAIELTAAIGDGEDRVTLPVDADGTLLLDRGGFVDVGGSGFRPGSTAEVWMFSTVTFLGTAIVDADGGFAGSFPIDELLEAGEHTIQLNGVGADEQVRSTSLGVRVDDPENSARERIAFAGERGEGAGITSGPVWLILLAALLGAATTRWWIVGRRRRDDEDAAADELMVSSAAR